MCTWSEKVEILKHLLTYLLQTKLPNNSVKKNLFTSASGELNY